MRLAFCAAGIINMIIIYFIDYARIITLLCMPISDTSGGCYTGIGHLAFIKALAIKLLY